MSEVKCTKCKDRGYSEYKDLDELCHYHWVPYKKRACVYCEMGTNWLKTHREG